MSEVVMKTPIMQKVEPFQGNTPAYWVINANEDDTISASNSQTGETFEGLMEDFNKRLRG